MGGGGRAGDEELLAEGAAAEGTTAEGIESLGEMPWLVRGALEPDGWNAEVERGAVDMGALLTLACDSLGLGSEPRVDAAAAAARTYPVAAAAEAP